MLNKNFFPTPSSIASKMYSYVAAYVDELHKSKDYRSITVLDPSAGKGDLLDAFKSRIASYGRYQSRDMFFAVEIEYDLQVILRDKYFEILGNDFLTDDIAIVPDLIAMNPPFDNGAEHLLRAWDLVIPGGHIVCLLNSETIDNPYSQNRKLLAKIIEDNGKTESLGQCFKDAERKTNVSVTLVHLVKPGSASDLFGDLNLEFENIRMPENMEGSNELEVMDLLLNREHRYNATIEAYKKLYIANKEFKDTIYPLIEKASHEQIKRIIELSTSSNISNFIYQFNGACWDTLLSESNFQKYMTEKVYNEFKRKFQGQRAFAFNKQNMITMLSVLFQNKTSIMENCLLEVFDIFTRYHKDNRCHVEGWKTNDAYKVNQKVILPRYVKFGEYGNKFSLEYSTWRELRDIDKALSHIVGIDTESPEFIGTYKTLENHFASMEYVGSGSSFDSTCESEFFFIRFFKKGTIHITFKDKLLWQWFNCKVAELRGYPLPEAKEVKKKAEAKGFSFASDLPTGIGNSNEQLFLG